MKLGGFGRLADYDAIRAAGFDYAELDLPEIEALDEDGFEAFLAKVKQTGFPVLTGARALPLAQPWFFTDAYDKNAWRGYMARACGRAARLGIRKIILGNGKARSLPDKACIQKEQNFLDELSAFATFAAEQGIEMILEPLGPEYSNYINTLPEAVRVIEAAGSGNLFLMADLRHLWRGGEPYEDIVSCAEYLHHVHVDYPGSFPARPYPTAEDGFDYAPFLEALKRAGYDDTLTIEADVPEDWKAAHDRAVKVLEAVL